jgi:hypothetical protein
VGPAGHAVGEPEHEAVSQLWAVIAGEAAAAVRQQLSVAVGSNTRGLLQAMLLICLSASAQGWLKPLIAGEAAAAALTADVGSNASCACCLLLAMLR